MGSGVILSAFIWGQPWVVKPPSETSARSVLILTVVIIVSTEVVAYYLRAYYVIMLVVGVIVALFTFPTKADSETKGLKERFIGKNAWIPFGGAVLSIVVNAGGLLIVGRGFGLYHGLIFGVVFGFSMVLFAYGLKRKVDAFKA